MEVYVFRRAIQDAIYKNVCHEERKGTTLIAFMNIKEKKIIVTSNPSYLTRHYIMEEVSYVRYFFGLAFVFVEANKFRDINVDLNNQREVVTYIMENRASYEDV
jgi:hypothetical protein